MGWGMGRRDCFLDEQGREILEGRFMRVKFDADSDILVLILRDDAPEDAVEEPGGVLVSYGGDGVPVSVEILNASARGLVPDGHLSVTLDSGDRAKGTA